MEKVQTHSPARAETTHSPARAETTHSPAQAETTHSSARAETTHSPARAETTHSPARAETTHSPARAETTHSSARAETTHSPAQTETSTERDRSSLLAGATKAASYNMVLQLMIRMLTFGLNAFVLRYISQDMLGVVNVRLTLLYTTTIFLAQEAFVKACLSKLEAQTWQTIINLMWCSLEDKLHSPKHQAATTFIILCLLTCQTLVIIVPASIVCSSLLAVLWLYVLERPDADKVPYYSVGVVCFAASAVMQMLSAPLFVIGQRCMFVKLKVLSMGSGELCKSLLTVTLLLLIPQLGLINFSIAQLVYGTVISLVYYSYFTYYIRTAIKKDDDFPFKNLTDMFPRRRVGEPLVDSHQASLTWSIFKQSFLKQILTEGEKYVMTIFGVLTFADQGIYDVVNNLGSMAARFLFQPIEESGYLFFSQLLLRGKPLKQQNKESIELATGVLSCLLKLVILVGTIILVFGYAYSYLALDLYGGTVLSTGSGPMLLRWYCLYVLVIAINGTTECFVFATMSKIEVDRYNQKMLVFSALFLVSSLGFTHQFGSVGFILANCLNMGARIIHSIYYILNYFKESHYKPLQGMIPSPSVIVVMVAAQGVTVLSESMLCCDRGILYRLAHIGVGGVCGVAVLLTIYLKESHMIQFIKDQYRKTRLKKD